MKKAIFIFSIAVVCAVQAIAQGYPLYEGYIRKYHPDEVTKYQGRPLWGVRRISAKLVDEQHKPVKSSDLWLRCFPCDDLNAFFEWKVPRNGVINQEFVPLGIDSFYVQICVRGWKAKRKDSKKILVTAKQRKGESIDLGVICLESVQLPAVSPQAMGQKGTWEEIDLESEAAQNRMKKPLFGVKGLRCKVVDEKGNPVSCPVIYSVSSRGNKLLAPYVGNEKGVYDKVFHNISQYDSLYVEFHHPYMQTKRILVNKDTPLFRYPIEGGRGQVGFLKGIDLGTVQMRHK